MKKYYLLTAVVTIYTVTFIFVVVMTLFNQYGSVDRYDLQGVNLSQSDFLVNPFSERYRVGTKLGEFNIVRTEPLSYEQKLSEGNARILLKGVSEVFVDYRFDDTKSLSRLCFYPNENDLEKIPRIKYTDKGFFCASNEISDPLVKRIIDVSKEGQAEIMIEDFEIKDCDCEDSISLSKIVKVTTVIPAESGDSVNSWAMSYNPYLNIQFRYPTRFNGWSVESGTEYLTGIIIGDGDIGYGYDPEYSIDGPLYDYGSHLASMTYSIEEEASLDYWIDNRIRYYGDETHVAKPLCQKTRLNSREVAICETAVNDDVSSYLVRNYAFQNSNDTINIVAFFGSGHVLWSKTKGERILTKSELDKWQDEFFDLVAEIIDTIEVFDTK